MSLFRRRFWPLAHPLAIVISLLAPLACRAADAAHVDPSSGVVDKIGSGRLAESGTSNAASQGSSQELSSAERSLMAAIASSDGLTAARLLDGEFTWIDRDGRSRTKSEVIDHLILLVAGADANLTVQPYGRVALITGTHRLAPDNAAAFFARVWIRRPSGWHLLLYQETTAEEFSVKSARYGFSGRDWGSGCENPCRSLPYKALSSDAEEIVASFMAGEEAAFDGDVQAASRILADDFLFVSADHAQPIRKAERIAAMRSVTRVGQEPPAAVVSMTLWVFGNAAVMAADQESSSGEMLRATRIWAKHNGQWQLAFGQQTPIQ